MGHRIELKEEEETTMPQIMEGHRGHGTYQGECCTCCKTSWRAKPSTQGNIWT